MSTSPAMPPGNPAAPNSQLSADASSEREESTGVLVVVFLTLIGLTLLNVYVWKMDLGNWNAWISLTIAVVKAALVGGFFMHLLHDRTFNRVVVIVTLLTLLFFVAIAALDVVNYQTEVEQFAKFMPDRVMPIIIQAQSGQHPQP